MTNQSHSLELVLRVSGDVELLNTESGESVWCSDGDNDFWEFIDADFVEESDLDEVLGYLADADILTDSDLLAFENGEFDIIIEEPDENGESDVIEGESTEM